MPQLKSGDEVCTLVDKELVFGTLEYEVVASPTGTQNSSTSSFFNFNLLPSILSSASATATTTNPLSHKLLTNGNGNGGSGDSSKMWKVKWIHDPSRTMRAETPENELIPTDRAFYKGCKVKMTTGSQTKVGICRSILYMADLRILGTNTVIPNVNIEEFSHLKEFKQKSVVHYQGWLGVITSVQRIAEVYHSASESTSSVDLKMVIPTGPLNVETFWINEQIDFTVRLPPLTNNSGTSLSTQASVASVPVTPNANTTAEMQESTKRMKRLGYIKDLKINSVKVQWIHQIDANFPDKPKQEFKNDACNKLEVIKEDGSIDDACFNFEVGNIGRYTINSQTEFLRWNVWQKKFANGNLAKNPEMIISEKLQSDREYDAHLKSNYWRAYDEKSYNEGKEDSLEKVKVGNRLVVEISHISSIADVRWEDNTFEIPPSSLDLEVLDEQILHDTDIPRPGDFIHVKFLPYKPEEVFCVVVNDEKDKNGEPRLIVRVLDANIQGKIIADNKILEGELRLSSKKIETHPIFGYFNEPTTIVVVNDADGLKIGNVIGTNLQGKVNVRFRNSKSASLFKEEWLWPQTCAIYSVKAYDLECVKSHVTDSEAENEPEAKLRRILESLKERVHLVWKNNSKLEDDLQSALDEFSIIHSSLENFIARQNLPKESIASSAYQKLKDYLQQPPDTRPFYMKGNFQLVDLVTGAVEEILLKGNYILQQLVPVEEKSDENEIHQSDTSTSSPSTSNSSGSPISENLETLFSKTVVLQDSHPESHHFAKSTKYEPLHHKTFLKTVKEELERLQKMCSTETQSEMGILIKTFGSRMDLFSILMRGPEGTPYENSLYIFDAVLPSNYPNVPPKFHFNAYRAGRLNPNLYAEGKVCVSLLGTWTGRDEREKWTKNSSIVQVLISIQGLILVKEPYHNEPGFEEDKESKSTAHTNRLKYNEQLMPLVANMILNQLEYPMEPWADEIQQFYKFQLPLFISRWRSWLKAKSEKELGLNKPEFVIFPMKSTFIKTMEAALAKLEVKCNQLHESN